MRLLIIALLTISTLSTFAQKKIESLFLQHKYNEILTLTESLSSEADYYWRALVMEQNGHTVYAATILKDGVNIYPKSKRLSKLSGEYLYKTGQFGEAKKALTKHLETTSCFIKLMKIYEFTNKNQVLIDSLSQRVENDTTNITYLTMLANAYQKIDSSDLAIETYETILKLNPNSLVTAHHLALLYLKSQNKVNTEQVIDICNPILENDSTLKPFRKLRGTANYRLGSFWEALPDFTYLVANKSRSFGNLKALGICEYETFHYEKAIKHLLQAHKKDSSDIRTCLVLGQSYQELAQADKALRYLNKIDILLKPSEGLMTSMLWEKQKCYALKKDYKMVIESLQELREYDDDPAYIFYVASNYDQGLHNTPKAIKYYELFLSKLEPKPNAEKENPTSLSYIAKKRLAKLNEDQFWEQN